MKQVLRVRDTSIEEKQTVNDRGKTLRAEPRRGDAFSPVQLASDKRKHARERAGQEQLEQRTRVSARDDAALTLNRDPDLASPRGEALRHLLYLFERDEAIRLLRAG